MHPGGIWSKDYVVIDLESLRGSPNSRFVPVLRVDRVEAHEGVAQFLARINATGDQTELYHELQTDRQMSLDCGGQPSADSTGATGEQDVEGRGPREELAGQNVAPLPPYHPGQWIDVGATDPSRLRPGYHIWSGRVTGIRKSNHPPECMPEVWAMLTPNQRKAWIEGAKKKGGASMALEADQAAPPIVADPDSRPPGLGRPEHVESAAVGAPSSPAMPIQLESTPSHRHLEGGNSSPSALAPVARPVGQREIQPILPGCAG